MITEIYKPIRPEEYLEDANCASISLSENKRIMHAVSEIRSLGHNPLVIEVEFDIALQCSRCDLGFEVRSLFNLYSVFLWDDRLDDWSALSDIKNCDYFKCSSVIMQKALE